MPTRRLSVSPARRAITRELTPLSCYPARSAGDHIGGAGILAMLGLRCASHSA